MRKKPIFSSVITGFLFIILFFSFSLAVSSPIPDRKLIYNERSLSLNNPIEQSNASRLLLQVQLEMQQANMNASDKHVKRNKTLKYAQNIGIAYLGGIIIAGFISWQLWEVGMGIGQSILIEYLMIPLGSTIALKFQRNENANPYFTYAGGLLSALLVFTAYPLLEDNYSNFVIIASAVAEPLGCAIFFEISNRQNIRKTKISKAYFDNSIYFEKGGFSLQYNKYFNVKVVFFEYNF